MTKQTLKQHIESQGRTITWIAKQINMSQPLLTMKLNGNARLDQKTINNVSKILGIKKENVII